MSDILDARGVPITPGDTAIYGFGVGRSIAMAEAIVLGAHMHAYRVFERTDYCLCGDPWPCDKTPSVSLTPSGRVRLRVVRRSYSPGQKPIVDVAPDRLVVLKEVDGPLQPTAPDPCFALPLSPLPTQAEVLRGTIENLIKSYSDDLRATEVPDRHHYEGISLAQFHAEATRRLAELRKELRGLDDPA